MAWDRRRLIRALAASTSSPPPPPAPTIAPLGALQEVPALRGRQSSSPSWANPAPSPPRHVMPGAGPKCCCRPSMPLDIELADDMSVGRRLPPGLALEPHRRGAGGLYRPSSFPASGRRRCSGQPFRPKPGPEGSKRLVVVSSPWIALIICTSISTRRRCSPGPSTLATARRDPPIGNAYRASLRPVMDRCGARSVRQGVVRSAARRSSRHVWHGDLTGTAPGAREAVEFCLPGDSRFSGPWAFDRRLPNLLRAPALDDTLPSIRHARRRRPGPGLRATTSSSTSRRAAIGLSRPRKRSPDVLRRRRRR